MTDFRMSPENADPDFLRDAPATDTLRDEKTVTDYISGLEVPATPEEVEATQPFSKQLVEDYGYPRSFLQTRPQYRVKSNPSGAGSYPIDIAVFSSQEKNRDGLYIVVECKKPGVNPEEGENRQLFNYMNMSSAALGVWTDGNTREFYRKIVDDRRIDYERIPNLPRYGESISEIGKYVRAKLKPPHNLNTSFRVIRHHLAGNAVGTTRDEVLAAQLINLVFCKIYDERFTAPDDLLTFRNQIGDTAAEVGVRVRELFAAVKAKYSDVFEPGDEVILDDEAIAYVVGELQSYALTEASRDAVGEAFEVFVGATLKGGQGQFFTPRNVIRLMVEIIEPKANDLVIDPACGAGGFIVETLRYKWFSLARQASALGWKQQALDEERAAVAMKTIFGIEKDSFLAKVAKAYMAILGDGKGGIFCEDSLDTPPKWDAETRRHVGLGRFDVVLANPPFGKEIKVTGETKLEQYQLGRKWRADDDGNKVATPTLLSEQNPQVLYVERCLQLAKDGGTIGLILPETYFHAPSPMHVRQFMTRHNVRALIDLPHNTFRPFNNAKCIAIIFEKNVPQQESILMVAADQMGHDHRGEPIYRYDQNSHEITSEIWDDLDKALQEVRSGNLGDYVFEVKAERVLSEDIFIPRYYWPKLVEAIPAPADYDVEWRTLGDFVTSGELSVSSGHGSPPATQKGRGSYPYIRVKDIINWEIYRDPTSGVPQGVFAALTKSRPLRELDVLYVARGSYRIGDVAMVGPADLEVALTREIHIFRVTKTHPDDLDPYYLLFLLTTPQVGQQTKARVFFDTTLPNIGQRYLQIRLPWAKDAQVRKEIASRVQTALQQRWNSLSDIRGLLSEIRPLENLDNSDEFDVDNQGSDSAD